MFSTAGFWAVIATSITLALLGRFFMHVNYGQSGPASASERITAYVCFSVATALAALAYVAASVAF